MSFMYCEKNYVTQIVENMLRQRNTLFVNAPLLQVQMSLSIRVDLLWILFLRSSLHKFILSSQAFLRSGRLLKDTKRGLPFASVTRWPDD